MIFSYEQVKNKGAHLWGLTKLYFFIILKFFLVIVLRRKRKNFAHFREKILTLKVYVIF